MMTKRKNINQANEILSMNKNKNMLIGFHEGEGTGKELISGAYSIAKILTGKYPKLKLIKVPNLYSRYGKINSNSKKVIRQLKTGNGAMISGAISGDNTYHLRSTYKFAYKIVEIKSLQSLSDISLLKLNIRKKIDWLILRHNKGIFTIASEKWIHKHLSAQWCTAYDFWELEQLAEIAFQLALSRKKKLVLTVKSKQKSKVIEVWKEAFIRAFKKFPGVEFQILNPDYAITDALVNPENYDIFFMPDIIGDTLADPIVTLINGNRNFDGSGNFSVDGFSYYNTIHGAAFDLEGKNAVNPIGTISNLALIFKYSFHREDIYNLIKKSANNVLRKYRTPDAMSPKTKKVSTSKMFELILKELKRNI